MGISVRIKLLQEQLEVVLYSTLIEWIFWVVRDIKEDYIYTKWQKFLYFTKQDDINLSANSLTPIIILKQKVIMVITKNIPLDAGQ